MENIKARLMKFERKAELRGFPKFVVLYEGDPDPPDDPNSIVCRVRFVEPGEGGENDERD
jgi:hypothetical protein